jgi:hypothetical protein
VSVVGTRVVAVALEVAAALEVAVGAAWVEKQGFLAEELLQRVVGPQMSVTNDFKNKTN